MADRSAAVGFLVLAGVAWALPFALQATHRFLPGAPGVVYTPDPVEVGRCQMLRWSPSDRVPESADGHRLGLGNRVGTAVGGWTGLLLGTPLDVNRATRADLESLPGVGSVTALAILELRNRRGGVGGLEELLDVPGIGPKTFVRLRPYLAVHP